VGPEVASSVPRSGEPRGAPRQNPPPTVLPAEYPLGSCPSAAYGTSKAPLSFTHPRGLPDMAKVDPLTGIDAAFLYMETPTQHMHVCGTMVFAPDVDGDDAREAHRQAVDRLVAIMLERIGAIPAFRRRIVEPPFRFARPAWVDVPRFRPRNHLRRMSLTAPGGQEQLAEAVGRVASVPLDRSRPLWQLWIVDGLENGRIALVLKVHHAVVDGVTALGILGRLFTTEARREPERLRSTARKRVASPTSFDLAIYALGAMARAPAKALSTLNRTGKALVTLAGKSVDLITTTERPAMPFSSPRTRLNRALTPERAVAFGRVSLAAIKQCKRAFGVTVNDIVLAACSRALGEYLRAHGEAPDRPLVATVPVSEHGDDVPGAGGNRVSAMFIGLPVHLHDLAAIVRCIHDQTIGAKSIHAAFGPSLLAEWADLMPPQLFAAAVSAYSRWKLADFVHPFHSVVISNVPGPPIPLYAGDARLVAAYPFGPVFEGAAANISVVSYAGNVDFGIITCPQAVPRPAEIACAFERAIDELATFATRTASAAASRRARSARQIGER
jgi:diacylglycerol O-acyltransferase / wax synthase